MRDGIMIKVLDSVLSHLYIFYMKATRNIGWRTRQCLKVWGFREKVARVKMMNNLCVKGDKSKDSLSLHISLRKETLLNLIQGYSFFEKESPSFPTFLNKILSLHFTQAPRNGPSFMCNNGAYKSTQSVKSIG